MVADLGNLFSVALLALLGTWIVGRFPLSERILVLVPLVLSMAITWAFGTLDSIGDVLIQGGASGLIASGFFHVFWSEHGNR